ncbi:10418_t:CDS:2, partial [Racocetra persica]
MALLKKRTRKTPPATKPVKKVSSPPSSNHFTQKELKQAYDMVVNDLFDCFQQMEVGQSVKLGPLGVFKKTARQYDITDDEGQRHKGSYYHFGFKMFKSSNTLGQQPGNKFGLESSEKNEQAELVERIIQKYFTKENLLILSGALAFILLRADFQKEWLLPVISLVCLLLFFYKEDVKELPLLEYLPLVGAFSSGFVAQALSLLPSLLEPVLGQKLPPVLTGGEVAELRNALQDFGNKLQKVLEQQDTIGDTLLQMKNDI